MKSKITSFIYAEMPSYYNPNQLIEITSTNTRGDCRAYINKSSGFRFLVRTNDVYPLNAFRNVNNALNGFTEVIGIMYK